MRRGGSRCACCPTRRRRCSRGSPASPSRPAAIARGTSRSRASPRPPPTCSASRRSARRRRASTSRRRWRCCGRCWRIRGREIGHDLKFDAIVLGRHGVALGGLPPTRCWRATCSTRPARATRWRSSRSSTPATRRSAKKTSAAGAPRRSPSGPSAWTRRSTTRASAPIWRCS